MSLSGCDFKKHNLEKNKLQKMIDIPPLKVVYKTSNNMTLEKIYNKWLSIQPLSEADQNKLSMRFTVEYNYNSNHLEGNTLTYGQTELLLLFGKVSGEGHHDTR